MSYLEISRILTFATSLFMTFGLYSQAWKIWKTKSAKDFASPIILAIVANEIVWLNYGLALREWPIIGLGMLNVPAVAIASIGFWKYRQGEKTWNRK